MKKTIPCASPPSHKAFNSENRQERFRAELRFDNKSETETEWQWKIAEGWIDPDRRDTMTGSRVLWLK